MTNIPYEIMIKHNNADLLTFLENKTIYSQNTTMQLIEAQSKVIQDLKNLVYEGEEIIIRLKIKEQQINQLIYELQKQKEH